MNVNGDASWLMSRGKRGVLDRSICPTESRAGPGQSRGDKRTERPLPLVRFPPKGREEDWSCSPDRSEDVLFCFFSALPLPAGSNITLGTKSLASFGDSLYWQQMQETYRHTDVQNVKMLSNLNYADGAKIGGKKSLSLSAENQTLLEDTTQKQHILSQGKSWTIKKC